MVWMGEGMTALELHSGPFRFDGIYIRDGAGLIFADTPGTPFTFRIRGWGRLGYLPAGAALQDELQQIAEECGAAKATTGEEAAYLLTEYWRTH